MYIILDFYINYVKDKHLIDILLSKSYIISDIKSICEKYIAYKQKKIDVDIPKLSDFIHKCYIAFARKLYQNVYLFEKLHIFVFG